jgi:hypothetical protein
MSNERFTVTYSGLSYENVPPRKTCHGKIESIDGLLVQGEQPHLSQHPEEQLASDPTSWAAVVCHLSNGGNDKQNVPHMGCATPF